MHQAWRRLLAMQVKERMGPGALPVSEKRCRRWVGVMAGLSDSQAYAPVSKRGPLAHL